MGQANLRGNYEQRKAWAIAKREADEKKRAEQLAAIEAALTPEQRKDRALMRRLLALGIGIAASDPATLSIARTAGMFRR